MRDILCTVRCEVQCEGYIVYSEVCPRYRVRDMMSKVMCVRGTGKGYVVYSDVCLGYRVRDMLCTVMCV